MKFKILMDTQKKELLLEYFEKVANEYLQEMVLQIK